MSLEVREIVLQESAPILSVEVMTQEELQLAMSWASDEGWNPGIYDHLSYYSQDPEGFLVLKLDGEPIGSISIVKYSRNFAFIGLFIIKPDYRGCGYGTKLWEVGLKKLESTLPVGLYAVPQQVNRYKRSGFSFSKQHMNQRWEMGSSVSERLNPQLDLIAPDTLEYQQMVEYDKAKWGSSRSRFFNTALQQEESYCFVSFDERGVKGYGLVRPCEVGFRVGPLYAESFETAQEITRHLLSKLPYGSKVFFDIPKVNTFSEMFAEYFNLDHVSAIDTYSMFKGEKPDTHEDSCYGCLSLEIG